MKRTLLLITVLLTMSTHGYAQTSSETVEYSTELEKESDFKIGKKYKYFDRNQIEEKSMLRVGVNSNINLGSGYFLEYEAKIRLKNAFSLGFFYDQSDRHHRESREGSGLTIGYKYFYSAKKQIETGNKANNLNGSFISLLYNRNIDDLNKNGNTFHSDATNFKLLWGVQKRLGRYGYLEFNTGLSYTPEKSFYKLLDATSDIFEKVNDPLGLTANLKLGFAIGNLAKSNTSNTPYLANVKSKMRSLTNQLKEEKTLVKIGLRDIDLFRKNFSMSNTLGIERKINPSLAVIIENDVNISTYKSVSGETDVVTQLNFHAGLRYYYSMNKRIERGLSANNFSANYLSLKGMDLYEGSLYKKRLRSHSRFLERRIALLWGMQRRIGKVGFVDFNVGTSYNVNPDNYEFKKLNFESKLNFGIGW